jgi:hypothetical protein
MVRVRGCDSSVRAVWASMMDIAIVAALSTVSVVRFRPLTTVYILVYIPSDAPRNARVPNCGGGMRRFTCDTIPSLRHAGQVQPINLLPWYLYSIPCLLARS